MKPTSRRETSATLARNELSPRNVHHRIAYAASSVAVLSSSRCGLVLGGVVRLTLLFLRGRGLSLSSCCLRKYEGEGGSIIVPVERPKRCMAKYPERETIPSLFALRRFVLGAKSTNSLHPATDRATWWTRYGDLTLGDLRRVRKPTQGYRNRNHRHRSKWEDGMQKDFENGKRAHCEEKVPVGTVFSLMFLEISLVKSSKKVISQQTHRIIGHFHED